MAKAFGDVLLRNGRWVTHCELARVHETPSRFAFAIARL